MSIHINNPAALRAVPRGVFPTMDSLQEVVDYAESKLPVTSKNEMTTLLMLYHNTLLKVLNETPHISITSKRFPSQTIEDDQKLQD